jgi:tRNA dimethylallyltransferase
MWIQWLVHGIPDAPKADEEVVKQADSMLQGFVAAGDWAGASALVSLYDRPRVEKLGKNDWYRLRRYLEVALSVRKQQGLTCSDGTAVVDGAPDSNEEQPSRLPLPSSFENTLYDSDGEGEGGESVVTGKRTSVLPGVDIRGFFVSEDREQLYHYIDTRCESMLKAGLFQEVTHLLTNDFLTPDSIAARAIGYRQTIDYLCRPDWKQFDVKAFDQYVRYAIRSTHDVT